MLLAPCSQERFCRDAFLVLVLALLGFVGCRGDSANDSSDSSSSDTTRSSSADQVVAVEDIPIPSLDADGLFQFMVDLDQDPLPPEPDERSKVVRQRCRARVFASDKILQEDIPPESKTSAVRMKLDALRTLSIVEPDGLGKQFETYSQQLIDGNDPLLARLAKAVQFQARVNDYVSYRKDEPDQLLQDLDQLLSEKDAGPMVFEAARESSKWLFPGEAEDDETFHKRILLQAKFLRRIGNRYLKHENTDLAEEAITVLVQADALELSALSDHVLAEKPDADQKLGSFLNELLSKKPPQPESIELAIQTAQRMEYEGQFRLALQIYQLTVKRAAENNLETETIDLERLLENAKKRLTILGEEFKIQGVQIDGNKFDWAEYRGKHVIVFFWASWFEHWDEEVQNITAQVDAIGQDRLAVVTVNLDDDKETAKTFLEEHKINWPVVVSPDPSLVGLESPMATRYGVEAIPFMVLISPEGKVLDIHVFGRRLSESLEKALNAATSSVLHDDGLRMVAFQAPASPVDAEADSIEADSGASDAISNRNPYAPPAGLSAFELLEFIWDMQEKPNSIQQRPGFTDGIVTAANQILDSDAAAKQKQEAILAILKFRHQDAVANVKGAESQLQEAIQRFAADENAKVKMKFSSCN
ncbi:MAG: TlpA disulfide reductase family protein [Pirellulaceae bacterium]